jgi:membrane fusion protein (multidrug efflux system)
MQWLSAIAFAALAMLHAAPDALAQGGPPPAKVTLDAARTEMVDLRRDVIGHVRAVSRSRVAAEEQGRVVELAVDRGDAVEAGDVLVRLDATLLALDLERAASEIEAAEATVAERRAALDRFERDLGRLEGLAARDGATESEMDEARTDALTAQARLRQAEASLITAQIQKRRLEARMADMTVRAPFPGRVVDKRTEVGEWIGEGDIVIDLVRIDAVDIVLDVPERFIGAIQAIAEEEGAAERYGGISIRVGATGEQIVAEDVVVIAEGDELARSFPVRVRVENPGGRMKPGMSVTASVPTGARGEMLTISKDAIMRNDAGPFVFIDDGGVAGTRPIDILFALGDRVAIRSGGVRPGTMLVVEGNERMFPTQPLMVLNGDKGGEAGGPSNANAGGPPQSDRTDSGEGV